MSRSSSSPVANESALYPYMISSSEEEPFEDLESKHDVTSHETASPPIPPLTTPIPPSPINIPPSPSAAMDQPARPTRPRSDVPTNYKPDMNCQELERMHQLTAMSHDHMTRLDIHS
nr:hypothetical protein [Tanacetum cinerariifolium]